MGGIFIFFWVVSFYISTKLLMRETQEIVVPKVIGFPLLEAERMLTQRKLKTKVDKYEETLEFPQNTVLAQSVEPGTIVKENRVLMLKVSKSKDRIEIPNLIEKELFEARQVLEKQNLNLASISYACSKKTKVGKIISQNPLSEDMGQDRHVQILVSSGPCQNQFLMGDLIDRRMDASIKKEFTDKEIEIKQLSTQRIRENLKKAKVVSQEPIAGSIVKSGDSVVLNME